MQKCKVSVSIGSEVANSKIVTKIAVAYAMFNNNNNNMKYTMKVMSDNNLH